MITRSCPAAQHCAMAHFTTQLLSLGRLLHCWTALGTSLDTTNTNLNCKAADSERLIPARSDSHYFNTQLISISGGKFSHINMNTDTNPFHFYINMAAHCMPPFCLVINTACTLAFLFLNNNSKCCPYWAISITHTSRHWVCFGSTTPLNNPL